MRSWSAECGCAAKPVVVGSRYTRVEALRLMHDMYKIPEPDTKQKISQTAELVIRNSCACAPSALPELESEVLTLG